MVAVNSLKYARVAVTLLLLTACSESSQSASTSGGATSAPSTGGSSAVAGSSTVGGTAGAATNTGGTGGPGTGGTAGGGGSTALTALDPNVPTPSHDCRTDTGENCISIAGTYGGTAIDIYCNAVAALQTVVHAGKWVIGCDDMNGGFARLYVPIQGPGSFAETATAASQPSMQFEFSTGGSSSVTLFASNLVTAELMGEVVVVSAPYREVSGTFHAVWATPDSSCSALSGSTCAVSNINVTFRIMTNYGSCFGNTDCTPPQTCNMVGYYCYG